MEKLKTVKEMYEVSKRLNVPLLSNFNAVWWNEYTSNFATYDKVFRRLYLSFKYFIQDGDESVEEVRNDFTDAVLGHLMVNNKKYSELYRIYVVNDEDYMLLDNYNITETKHTEGNEESNNDIGERTDIMKSPDIVNKIGAQENTNSVSPFDASRNDDFYDETHVKLGARQDVTEAHNITNEYGMQTNHSLKDTEEDYTLKRKGNIGVQTGADMLDKHRKFWSVYEFYTLIFKDIARELLLS